MRTYLALAERARHFDSLPEVQEALAAALDARAGRAVDAAAAARPTRSRPRPTRLDALAARGYGNEALDQLLVEVLLGVR